MMFDEIAMIHWDVFIDIFHKIRTENPLYPYDICALLAMRVYKEREKEILLGPSEPVGIIEFK